MNPDNPIGPEDFRGTDDGSHYMSQTRIRSTKQQPSPVANDGPCIQDLVIKDMEGRKVIGLAKYGTLLQPFNGRDALRDAYEEALDLAQYLRQAIEERDARATSVLGTASA